MNTLKFILIGALGLYLLVGVFIYFMQEALIFRPVRLERDFEYEFDAEFEEHFIPMSDGAEINALHFKTDNSKGLILYFHGNAGSLERWGEIVIPYTELGYEVLIIDYRGYGKSTGKRNRKNLINDADEVYAFTKTITSEDRIILFGRSLGSSFASYLAGKTNASKLILETPFYSLEDVADGMLPIYPTSALLRYRFQNHLFLKEADLPIYIFHGTEDEVVPYESGKRLYESLEVEKANFTTIKGGHHNDLIIYKDFWNEMKKVLNE